MTNATTTPSMQRNLDWITGTIKGTQYALSEATGHGAGYYMMEAADAPLFTPEDTFLIQLTRRGSMLLWNLSLPNMPEAARNNDARRVVCIVARPSA